MINLKVLVEGMPLIDDDQLVFPDLDDLVLHSYYFCVLSGRLVQIIEKDWDEKEKRYDKILGRVHNPVTGILEDFVVTPNQLAVLDFINFIPPYINKKQNNDTFTANVGTN